MLNDVKQQGVSGRSWPGTGKSPTLAPVTPSPLEVFRAQQHL